ncbi:hypothetical protein [Terrabacter terrigena]|uniref:DNA recombination protein RmuC n=1 Tax=Terrabacter terrigena TaxID=574718 RepID=A0ABW3MWL9_9MICO
MSEGVIGALVTLLIAGGGGLGYLIRRRDNQKDPIPKQSAAVATSAEAVEMMRGVASDFRQDIKDLRADLSNVKLEAQANQLRLEGQVVSLASSVETLDSSLSAALRYIEQLIRYLRSGAHGPEPAVPGELRDLIDPMLRHWGSPSPAD